MKRRMIGLVLGGLALLACATGTVQAQQQAFRPHFFAGGGVGWGMADFDSSDFSPSAAAAAIRTIPGMPAGGGLTGNSDDSSVAWKLFGGYQFLPWLAVEASYANLGEFTYDYFGTGTWALGGANVKYKVSSWNLAAVGILPLGQFGLYGKLGAAFTNAKLDFTISVPGASASASERKSKTNLLWGLGARYDFHQNWAGQLEYENYGTVGNEDNTGRVKASAVYLNVMYKF
jgi:OOP family OmpA-OmpF porin